MSAADRLLELVPFVSLAALCAFGIYHWGRAAAVLLARRPLEREAAAAPPAAAPAAPFPPSRWAALPDPVGRLELGDSGFAITMHPLSDNGVQDLYRVWTPEGRLLWRGCDLPVAKSIGERFAAERSEFFTHSRVAVPFPTHHPKPEGHHDDA